MREPRPSGCLLDMAQSMKQRDSRPSATLEPMAYILLVHLGLLSALPTLAVKASTLDAFCQNSTVFSLRDKNMFLRGHLM